MTRDSSAAAVYFALFAVALGPFALTSAYAWTYLWTWFLYPLFRATPTSLQMYCVFAIFGLFRTARYVQDGHFKWKDAVIGSILTPGLLLLAGYLIHVGIQSR